MAVIDDLVASGLSGVQAKAVVDFNAGTATAAGLAAAGFSKVQVDQIVAENTTGVSSADLVATGLWAGTQVPAIEAALAVVV